ncbi:unnamed protein product [Prorocentrum cordatum]|uniref:Uncharacterized protein n=1 Tax=Prorocentrum cordatum TaxID=2364126 RepID=A0ABN9XF00_9DINO|nr:unnamed protein product [Polarella glacialis]
MSWLGLPEGLLGVLDRWGVPALQAWVARCPATDIPPCPACPACPPYPAATVGATASAVAFACLAAGLAGASFGDVGAIAALRLRGPLRFTAESRGQGTAPAGGVPSRLALAAAADGGGVGLGVVQRGRRAALPPEEGGGVIIVTPDDMVYAERLLAAGPDIAAGRFSAVRWPPPPGIAPEATYRFGRAPSAERKAAWLAAATAEADSEFARRHPGAPLPAGGALISMSGGLLPGAPAPAAAVPAAVPAPAGWAWVVADDVVSFSFGTVVQVGPIPGIVLAARAGRRGIVTLGAGVSAVAFIFEDWRRADFASKWRGSAPRTTAWLPGSVGPRSWLAVAETAKEVVDPLFVLQPRSASWCVSWLLREGGPIQHRESWKARKRLSTSDYGVAEHHALSTVLEDLATIDEVNVANLVGVERLLRRMQLIEHFLEEKQREQGASQQKLAQEEISAFMGGAGASSRPCSTACPAPLAAVGKELERVSQLKKNAHKLREEAKAAPGAEAGAVAWARSGSWTSFRCQCLLPLTPADWLLGRELQAALSYDGALSTRAEVMGVSRPSLPPPCNCPVALGRLLESEVFDSVYRDISVKVLPKTEVLQLKRDAGFGGPCVGPILRDRHHYAALVLRLLEAGVIDLVGDPIEVMYEVGLFSVPGKSGRRRLDVGAPPANFLFSDPADVHLATEAALAAIELPDGASLWAASADVADAFYNVELPHAWRPYFALLWPRLAVLPMGWTRALAVCQRVSESAADRAGLASAARVVDRQICPGLAGGAHLEYVDKFASLSLDRDTAEQMENDMVATLRESGAWRLILATRALLDMPKVSAQQERPLLSIFSAVYRFAAKAGEAPRQWWPSMWRELAWAMGVVPLALADLRAEWPGRVPCADASERGRGCLCAREFDASIVQRLGRVQERWRFRDPDAKAPRGQLMMLLEPNESLIDTEPPSRPIDFGSSQAPAEPFDIVRMARICRRWAAIAVAGGIGAALRWMPSEANPVDLPSRRALRIGARLQWDAVASLAAQEPRSPGGDGARPTRSRRGAGPRLKAKAAEAAARRAGRAAARAPEAASLRASAGHALRALSVTVAARAKYLHQWEEFALWLATASVALRAETADDPLAQWMGQQYAEGWNPERGARMLATLKFMMPQFARRGLGLPKALQSLRGWRRRVPARAGLPLPWEVVALVAARLIDVGQTRAAIYVLVTFAGYLRPPEALRALGSRLIPPAPGGACGGWSLVLRPRELAVPSKTQVRDEVSALFKQAAIDAGVEVLVLQLCQLRHSGPSVELALALRAPASAKLRGRRRSGSSVARYLEPGRVNEQMQRVRPAVQRAALLVFSGEGILAAALRREGALVIEWGIAWGPDWDLTVPKVARLLRGWLDAGLIWGMRFGVPCQTWTRIKGAGPLRPPGEAGLWPSRLRSDAEIRGLAAVTHPEDRAHIDMANKLVTFCEGLWASCRRVHIPFAIENPAMSRLWLVPSLRRLRTQPRVFWAASHYCHGGTPWKKPTGLLGFRVDVSELACQCLGSRT